MPARSPGGPDPEALARLADLLAAMAPGEVERFAATLDPDDLSLLEAAMSERLAIGWRAGPATMAAYLDSKFTRWRYVDYLSQKFVDAAEGRSKRQIWSLHGRLGKSVLGSQWGPLWVLDRTEGVARFILVGYGQHLAVENAVGIRDRLREHGAVLRCQLRRDRGRMDRFVTDQGGGVVAAGIDGSIRGFGAGAGGGIIIDDPFKNWQDAHSENARNLVWNQYRGTLLDRADDEDVFIIVIHHRVHEDDLTGRLMEDAAHGGEQWEHVRLPALAEANDPLGRAVGEPIEPERFGVSHYESQRRAMGSYLFSGLFQQAPAPEEGTELLREWFQLYETPPASADASLTSWDLKLKDREAGDFVVGQVWWRTGPDFWLRDQIRGGFDHATTANAIALLSVRWPEVRRHVVEAAGAADEVLPLLRRSQPDYVVDAAMAGRLGMTEGEREAVQALRRRGMSGVVSHPPKGDKSVRARTYIAPTAEAGNVRLPAYGEFTPHLLDEVAAFPQGANDDQVDAMSQALQRLAVGTASASAPSGAIPTPPAGQAPTMARRAAPTGAKLVGPGRRRPRPGPV